MSSQPSDSVVLLTGQQRFGSAFVFHHDAQGVYLATCSHVLRDVGGVAALTVAHNPAVIVEVIADGANEGIDLAVLRCTNAPQLPVLRLAHGGAPNMSVTVVGFSNPTTNSFIRRGLPATLGEPITFQARGKVRQVAAWDLYASGLAGGYSGAPVIDQHSKTVIAIASHAEYEGNRGQAISIQELAVIWPTFPPELIVPLQLPPTQPTPKSEQQQPGIGGPISITNSTVRDVYTGIMTKTEYHDAEAPNVATITLDQAVTDVRTALEALPDEEQVRAAAYIVLLDSATHADKVNLASLEAVRNYLLQVSPATSIIIDTLLYHPALQHRILATGLGLEFTRRFGHR